VFLEPFFVSNPNQLWYVRAFLTPYNDQYVFRNAVSVCAARPLSRLPHDGIIS